MANDPNYHAISVRKDTFETLRKLRYETRRPVAELVAELVANFDATRSAAR